MTNAYDIFPKHYGGTIDKSNVNCITLLSELLLLSRIVNLDQSPYSIKIKLQTKCVLLGSKL